MAGPNDTAPAAPSTGDTKLSSSTKLKLVVGGLVAVALIIAALTIGYWRHTRPDGTGAEPGERGDPGDRGADRAADRYDAGRYDPDHQSTSRPADRPVPRPEGPAVPPVPPMPRTAAEFGVRGQSHVTVDPPSNPPGGSDQPASRFRVPGSGSGSGTASRRPPDASAGPYPHR